MGGKLDEYIKQVKAEHSGIPSPQPGQIPTYEQASAYFGWSQPSFGDDSVSQLIQGMMGTKNPYGSVSDDMRQWYSAATDYAEKLGYWPQWEVLGGLGVPVGQPYKPADTSDVVGIADEYTASMFGVQQGQPVTQNMFNQVQGSTDFQTMSDEARRYSQISEIMKSTNYDAQTAAFIYDTFLNDAGFEGGSAWAKGTYTPDEWRNKLKDNEQMDMVDEDALNEFYRTVPQYSQLRSFDEWLGVDNALKMGILKEGIEKNKGLTSDGSSVNPYTGEDSSQKNYINVTYLHDNYFPQAVKIVNSIADRLRQEGNVAKIIKFVRESGINEDATFSIDESLKALKWLADNGEKDAQVLWQTIMDDIRIYRPTGLGMPVAMGVL